MNATLKLISLFSPVFVCFFWAIILIIRNHSTRQPGFYMFLLMLNLGFLMGSILPYYFGDYSLYYQLDAVFYFCALLIFPLIFFYLRSLAKREAVSAKDYLHFIPGFFFFSVSVIIHLLLSRDENLHYASNSFIYSESSFWLKTLIITNAIAKSLIILQMVLYFILCQSMIHRFRRKVLDYFSDLNSNYFNWIWLFYTVYSLASVTGAYLIITGNSKLNTQHEGILISSFILLSIVFFVIAFIANHQRYIENDDFYTIDNEKEVESDNNDLNFQKLLIKLEAYFDKDQPYLNPDLKITDVSSYLLSNRTYVSHLIKNHYHTNFNNYVNTYRVKEAIRLFHERENRLYTSRGISETVGFNNYNSFVKAFRDVCSTTPGKYREKIDID